ncbi:YopX family protein [Neobacillus mesonae]|uniref:YopX protein domain-containing protein n=1 Tax=Neobacillus mesonae TaxID=1193713 RepID=A0A3Q9QQW4_9BACI|nr:YopX family protein [Neobacillus mesonae]AZU61011.1 hypothetical protein CHR53_06965 [Neobacillus mesonae]
MREIKFRGYDGMDWIYGTAVLYVKETDTWYMIESGAPDDDWLMVSNIGQFTGLRDSRGQEIYDGDIVRYWQRNLEKAFGMVGDGNDFELKTRKIKYSNQSFNVPSGFIKELQVIGNIYEN